MQRGWKMSSGCRASRKHYVRIDFPGFFALGMIQKSLTTFANHPSGAFAGVASGIKVVRLFPSNLSVGQAEVSGTGCTFVATLELRKNFRKRSLPVLGGWSCMAPGWVGEEPIPTVENHCRDVGLEEVSFLTLRSFEFWSWWKKTSSKPETKKRDIYWNSKKCLFWGDFGWRFIF